MGRSPCCSKEGMNRGAWTQAEDKILTDYIKLHGEGRWRNVPKEAGLKRCGKSCRLRWMNYLRPDIKRGNISPDEEDLIIRLHKLLGNRWSLIAGRLPGRTDNEIKNYWNTNLSKREQGKERRPKLNQAKADKKPMEKKMDENSNSSDVIRTKASRCKEVFITLDDNQQHRTENRAINVSTPPSMDANLQHYNNNNSNIQAESTESSDGSLITLPFYKEENLDFMVDVIAADENIGVSDLLASDFTNLSHGLEISTSEMDNVIRGEEHAFLLPVEMEQKWSSGSNYIQADYESDSAFVSLVAFLELTEEWLI